MDPRGTIEICSSFVLRLFWNNALTLQLFYWASLKDGISRFDWWLRLSMFRNRCHIVVKPYFQGRDSIQSRQLNPLIFFNFFKVITTQNWMRNGWVRILYTNTIVWYPVTLEDWRPNLIQPCTAHIGKSQVHSKYISYFILLSYITNNTIILNGLKPWSTA